MKWQIVPKRVREQEKSYKKQENRAYRKYWQIWYHNIKKRSNGGMMMEKTKERKNTWYCAVLAVLMAVMLIMPYRTVHAAGMNLSNATAVKVGSTVKNSMKKGSHYYKFSITGNSIVYFYLKTGGHSQHLAFSVRDSKGDLVGGYNLYQTSVSNNRDCQAKSKYLGLNKGTYYVQIQNASTKQYSYSFSTKLSQSTVGTTKIAGYSNNYLSSALPVAVGNRLYSVSYSSGKVCHYYRFSLSATTKVKFQAQALDSGNGISCYLYNSKGGKLTNIVTSVKKGTAKSSTLTLTKGTYYIGIYSSNYYGRYIVQTSKIAAAKSAQTITASSVKKYMGDQAFSIGAKLTKGNGSLSYASSNSSVAVISSKGTVTLKGVGKTTITITASETSTYKKTSKQVTVTVYPKATSITSLTVPATGKMTVRWNKVSGSTGYHVQYCESAGFTNPKAYYAASTVSGVKFSNLTKGKTYYVRVRTYKTVSNVRYCSKWCTVKKIVMK